MDEPGPHLRASDADRERVAEQLRASLGEGRLTLDEFDERVAAVYAARTYGELSAVTADLPATASSPVDLGKRSNPDRRPERARQRQVRRHGAHPIGSGWGSWLSVNLVLLAIWTVTVLTGSGAYPWFLWVAVPWGASLLGRDIQHRLR